MYATTQKQNLQNEGLLPKNENCILGNFDFHLTMLTDVQFIRVTFNPWPRKGGTLLKRVRHLGLVHCGQQLSLIITQQDPDNMTYDVRVK